MAIAPPLENKGPLSGCYRLAQDACHTRLPLREVQRLGQDVRQLGRGWYEDKYHMTVLDHFVREELPDINVSYTKFSTVFPLFATDSHFLLQFHYFLLQFTPDVARKF